MRIIQFVDRELGRSLGVVQGEQVVNLTASHPQIANTVQACHAARSRHRRLEELLLELLQQQPDASLLNYPELLATGQVLPPLDEVAGTRLLVSGTGLTHLGSVQQRDTMHQQVEKAAAKSDSRKMFELGLAGGRPAAGQRGAMPEWFYKGDGRVLRGPGQTLDIPSFAPDGGEEPEVVGLYLVDADGLPYRLGFTQGNEWSDHATENVNYLYLAPSKLRVCAIGPELVTDFAFDDVRGRCRVWRGAEAIYDAGELTTGERNMCHSLANLEDHHFKYAQHRRPGDLHVHFLGTSKLSFQHRHWQYRTGDVVEVTFAGLGAPLRNPVQREALNDTPVTVAQA